MYAQFEKSLNQLFN